MKKAIQFNPILIAAILYTIIFLINYLNF